MTSEVASPSPLARPLTRIEHWYRLRNVDYSCPPFQVYAEYSTPLSPALLLACLRKLVYRYDQLSLQVFPTATSHEIRILQQYTLGDVLEIMEEPEYKISDLLYTVSKRRLKLGIEKPLWKLILLNGNKLVFYCDHLAFDGTSAKNIHVLLRNTLNQLSENEIDSNADLTSTLFDVSEFHGKIGPSHADLINYTPSWSYYLYAVWSHVVPKNVRLLFKRWSSEPLQSGLVYSRSDLPKMTENWNYCKTLVNIPAPDVKRLLTSARSQNVKLTAVLTTVMHLALLPIAGDNDTITGIPVSLRNQVAAEYDTTFGLFMSQVSVCLASIRRKYGAEVFNWDYAREIQAQMNAFKDVSQMELGLLELVDLNDFLKECETKPKSSILEVSNLMGVTNYPADRVKIVDMVFSQPPGFVSSLFGCNVIGTDLGGINLLLTGVDGMESEFEVFKKGVLEWLERVLSEVSE